MGQERYLQVGQRIVGRVSAVYQGGVVVEFWNRHGVISSTEIPHNPEDDIVVSLSIGETVQAWIASIDDDARIDLTLIERYALTELDQETVAQIEQIVRLSLKGGEADPALRAIQWLADTKDTAAKKRLLTVLAADIDQSLDSKEATVEAVRFLGAVRAADTDAGSSARWRRLEIALMLDAVLRDSLDPRWSRASMRYIAGAIRRVPTRADRLRDQIEHEQHRARHLRRLGVSPGSGLPFWSLYLSRRKKKSWDA